MPGYVDIHAHVLPGIDDGPSDLEGALALARAAAGAGIVTIATTPHLRPDFPDVHVRELADRARLVREAIEREQIPIRLVQGAEASLTWALEAPAEELALASYDQRRTDVLIETPALNVVGLDRLLYELRAKGYRVTLGHPERSPYFQHDDALLRELVDQGVLLQINADSLLASGGSRTGKLARHLCQEGLVHAIASDGHRGERWRPVTVLADGVSAAAELVGPERAQWMAEAAPGAIIEGAELPDAPEIVPQRRVRRLFGRR